LKVLEPASWSRIPSRHEGLRPTTSQKEKKKTSRDQKLKRKNIDQDHQPVMHQTTIPATISTPENQSAGARKRARERREREHRNAVRTETKLL
jgi:hypothetical protein